MPEHTIPEQLIDQLRKGRAALVVGAGIGIPSWKQLLERINDELRNRGQDGDEAFARDVDKLLHKGNLVRAAGFLARTVGEAACDRHVAEAWSLSEDETPDVALALARLPFKQVWTTFPGNALETAMEKQRPEDWPSPRVVTYKEAGSIDRRRRTLLKVLGDFDSFIVTPKSIRAALSGASELREFIREEYAEGTLILVGFRYGDPDLAALLDRVFGSFEPPETNHYLVASGVGPVTVDELDSEHHMQVINLPGKGADEKATHALLGFLEALRDSCESAGITLSQARPDDDDLDAWVALWSEDASNSEARDAVLAIEASARDAGDSERLIEVLMSRAELEDDSATRASILRQVADVFETQIGDLPGAFTALTAALRELPSDTSAVDEAERLAEAADGWTELVGDVSEVASEIEDQAVAAIYWAKLGNWYHHKLNHLDYAVASFSQSLKRNPNADAHEGLENVYRVQQRWSEMAESLGAHVELVGSAERVPLLLRLGELCESQLASASRAVDAYQQAADIDPQCDDALVALERIYRREERWGKLAKVLENRADVFESQGDAQRASVTRRELATLRAEKLGDLEGAITKYEAQLEAHAHDVEALRALEDLYERVGRNEEYLQTLERLADVVPDSERPQMLRRVAVELEDREGGRDKAIECYRTVLDLEPQAEDAHRALARLYRSEARWHDLVDSIEQHIGIVKAPAPRAELFVTQANIYEKRLDEPERAIEAHLNALGAIDDHRDSIDALSRLYQATAAWQRAVDTLVSLAKLAGDAGADHWADAGRIAAEQLDDPDMAEQHFEKALGLGTAHLGALLGLAKLHRARGAWANAVKRLVAAEQVSTNRLERVQLLLDAADIREEHLEDAPGSLALLLKVLEIDPEHSEAGVRAGERLMEASRYDEALPILEAMARNTDASDPVQMSQREEQLGRVCAALNHRQKSIKHYRAAVGADVDNHNAAFGLAATLFVEAHEIGAAERWQEAYKAYRDILARHRDKLEDEQVSFTWHRVGLAARALKNNAKAEDAFRRALEHDSTSEPVLASLVEVTNANEDWNAVIDAKTRQARLLDATEETQFSLYEEIGDIAGGKLDDRDRALEAYKKAIAIHPDSHQILHKTLDIHSETRNWRQAVDILDAIAETAKDRKRRAKYYYTAAVISRDELGDKPLGIDYFSKAIEENPDLPKAFDALEQLLTEKQDWKPLARLYRKVLKQMGEDAPGDTLLRLWGRLGDVCIDHLDDQDSAIAAYEVALSLDPDDLERHEQLANLYLDAGDSRRHDAIEQLQILIHHSPDRVELYRALSELYLAEGEIDKAYCLAQALVFLGAATDTEKDLFGKLRPRQFVLAKNKLTEELWQKSIIHQKEDRHLNAIFAQVVGSIAATTAQPPSAFNISRAGTDVGRDKRPVTKVFQYATNILGLEPEPHLYVQPSEGDGVRVANTADKGKLVPTVVVGGTQADKTNERELAFEVGKRLAYFRPERYVHYALQTLPKLESAYYAALCAADAENAPAERPGEIGKLSDHLKKTVPGAVLEQVGAVANRMNVPAGNGVVAGWRTATDLTANRVGFILCNDLETAARVVATEPSGMSPLSAKDRLRDLLAYAVSEEYFSVRRHLGIAVSA